MATIQKRVNPQGVVSYRVMVRRKGFKTLYATFPKHKDAETYASEAESKIIGNRAVSATPERLASEPDETVLLLRKILDALLRLKLS